MPQAEENPYPGNFTVEIRNPQLAADPSQWAAVLGREGMDYMSQADPVYQSVARQFRATMTQPQLDMARRRYLSSPEIQRSYTFEEYLKAAETQEFIGGYVFDMGNWRRDAGYTPQQKALLDKLSAYMWQGAKPTSLRIAPTAGGWVQVPAGMLKELKAQLAQRDERPTPTPTPSPAAPMGRFLGSIGQGFTGTAYAEEPPILSPDDVSIPSPSQTPPQVGGPAVLSPDDISTPAPPPTPLPQPPPVPDYNPATVNAGHLGPPPQSALPSWVPAASAGPPLPPWKSAIAEGANFLPAIGQIGGDIIGGLGGAAAGSLSPIPGSTLALGLAGKATLGAAGAAGGAEVENAIRRKLDLGPPVSVKKEALIGGAFSLAFGILGEGWNLLRGGSRIARAEKAARVAHQAYEAAKAEIAAHEAQLAEKLGITKQEAEALLTAALNGTTPADLSDAARTEVEAEKQQIEDAVRAQVNKLLRKAKMEELPAEAEAVIKDAKAARDHVAAALNAKIESLYQKFADKVLKGRNALNLWAASTSKIFELKTPGIKVLRDFLEPIFAKGRQMTLQDARDAIGIIDKYGKLVRNESVQNELTALRKVLNEDVYETIGKRARTQVEAWEAAAQQARRVMEQGASDVARIGQASRMVDRVFADRGSEAVQPLLKAIRGMGQAERDKLKREVGARIWQTATSGFHGSPAEVLNAEIAAVGKLDRRVFDELYGTGAYDQWIRTAKATATLLAEFLKHPGQEEALTAAVEAELKKPGAVNRTAQYLLKHKAAMLGVDLGLAAALGSTGHLGSAGTTLGAVLLLLGALKFRDARLAETSIEPLLEKATSATVTPRMRARLIAMLISALPAFIAHAGAKATADYAGSDLFDTTEQPDTGAGAAIAAP